MVNDGPSHDEDGSEWDAEELHPTWREYRPEVRYTCAYRHARRTIENVSRVLEDRKLDGSLCMRARVTGEGRVIITARLDVESWDGLVDVLDTDQP